MRNKNEDRTFWALIIFLMIVVGFTSCSSDDTEQGEQNLLIGRWFFDTETVNGFTSNNRQDFSDCPTPKEEYVEFFEDGRLVYFEYTGCQDAFNEYTYELRASNTISVDAGFEVITAEILVLTQNRLDWEYISDVDGDGELDTVVERYFR